MTQQTVQTIGKTRFIVVSNFKPSNSNPKDKIANLLRREIQDKALQKPVKARYTNGVNAV